MITARQAVAAWLVLFAACGGRAGAVVPEKGGTGHQGLKKAVTSYRTPKKGGTGHRDPTWGTGRAREVLTEVFRDDVFWWKRTAKVADPNVPWLVAAMRAIGRWIDVGFDAAFDALQWLLRHLKPPISAGGSAGRWLAWLLLAGAAAVVAWRCRYWLAGRISHRGAQPVRTPHDAQEKLPAAAELLDRATAAYPRGAYRDAVRYAFLALLATLQDRALVRRDRARTNGEFYRDLQESTALGPLFGQLVTQFERAWYGGLPVGPDDAARMIADCRRAMNRDKVET